MRQLIILSSLIIALASCSVTKNMPTNSTFTKEETQLILSGKASDTMRVLLITNPADSILLRTKSQPVVFNAKDKMLKHFTDRLLTTVQDSATMGIGIAAPQVGVLKDIIWVQRLDKEAEPFEVYINPKILKYTDLKQDVPEGCLSIPDFRAMTKDRAYAIFLTYLNQEGKEECEMVEAFTAAIFQHEIDHLNGILFLDHLEQEQKQPGKHKVD